MMVIIVLISVKRNIYDVVLSVVLSVEMKRKRSLVG